MEMTYGNWLILLGVILAITTIKRPSWLGGPTRRYTSEDTANAMLTRASRRSLAGYLIFGGVMMALVGI